MMTCMGRATPLPPEERRAAIIAATEPLLLARGQEVSTREIAEAAGIAEGTIFRVFATKDELIDAVFADAFDPEAGLDELERIDPTLDLESRVTEVARIFQRRVRRTFALINALGYQRLRELGARQGARRPDRTLAVAAVAAVLEPDRQRLRVSPQQAARLLTALVMSLGHPMMAAGHETEGQPDPREIARLLLYGIAHPSTHQPAQPLEALTRC